MQYDLPDYTQADLKRWYHQRDLSRSDDYLGAVRIIQVAGGHITATVQGSSPYPYAVQMELTRTRAKDLHLSAACSCPVGWLCKHTAAVLRVLLGEKADPAVPRVNPDVLRWLNDFRAHRVPPRAPSRKKPAPVRQALFYLLIPTVKGDWAIEMFKCTLGKQGEPTENMTAWNNVERALVKAPAFVQPADQPILRLLWAGRSRERQFGQSGEFPLVGELGEDVLLRMLGTGRLVVGYPPHFLPLRRGAARQGRLSWTHDEHGHVLPALHSDTVEIMALWLATNWYVDIDTGEIGPLEFAQSPELIRDLLDLPPLSQIDLPVVAGALAELAPDLPPPALPQLRVIEAPPAPVMYLDTLDIAGMMRWRGYDYGTDVFDYAMPVFEYEGIAVDPGSPAEFVTLPSGETVQLKRQPVAEQQAIESLGAFGLKAVAANQLFHYGALPGAQMYGLEREAAWPAFMQDAVPKLRAAGWRIEIASDFQHYALEVEAWDAEFSEAENGWFSLDMGIVVEGQRLPLAPLLYHLFQRDARWLDAGKLKRLAGDTPIDLQTEDGRRIRVPAERLKPIARTLIDLFDGPPGDSLKVSRFDAPRLAELSDMKRWQFKGEEAVQSMAKKLGKLGKVKPVKPPKGLGLELRPYQLEGVAWLQYLREHELAGILADDMGLGKTAQTLAHLLLEKESGRLDRPALVVLPTSLIFNWKREAERFAPALKVLSLHGKDRAERFASIPEHDVCLTTYPLLWRDIDTLAGHAYHLLILDEAQTVKNAASQSAQAVRKLEARHRLCLTGTPLENHLGELWAQFDFLLPGFLGDSKGFAKTWRTPVEKHGNGLRRDLLAARVKPFILRRRKEEVAKELPPKTIIVRTVELEGGQRDLYETVRTAMDVRVREEIAAKGFNRSQIVILDALLKLRQVCCDPRLLKLDMAKKVKERAKLDLLMDIVPEMVEEGRKILLFSQFTSMLALIQAELDKHGIPFVLLTGDTQDRESVITRFQDGAVPVFLISLKAGGVGLNLTAADTVIHFDPWWNPAVENQATDRAHRLGQTRNVFVYKLVVAGSIEEKILALQEKKAELAAGVLSEDGAALTKFGEADIQALLAPLPAAGRG